MIIYNEPKPVGEIIDEILSEIEIVKSDKPKENERFKN